MASTLSLLLALAIGVGAFLVTRSHDARTAASDASRPLSATPSSMPAALASLSLAPPIEQLPQAVTIIPVREQPMPATREATQALTDAAPESAAPPVAAPPAPSEVVRAAAAPRVLAPALAAGDRVNVTLSFYYCERGTVMAARGDGGGFCGAMRDGNVVYAGAAACDAAYLGQRFAILGDPLQRVYRCADTGSAVRGLHRDIWFNSSDDGWGWQQAVGHSATIEILP